MLHQIEKQILAVKAMRESEQRFGRAVVCNSVLLHLPSTIKPFVLLIVVSKRRRRPPPNWDNDLASQLKNGA